MKPPNHGMRVRVSTPRGHGSWVGRPLYLPANRRWPYQERSGIEILVDEGQFCGYPICILRGDRIELLP